MSKTSEDIYIKMQKEMVEKPLQKAIRDKEISVEERKKILRRVYNGRYYNKNRARLNRRRNERHATPRGAFLSTRQRAKWREEEWTMSFEEWTRLWMDAPDVWDVGMKMYRRPFSMRGRGPNCVQLCRKDLDGPWSIENVEIRYKNQKVPADGVVPDWDFAESKPKDIKLLGGI